MKAETQSTKSERNHKKAQSKFNFQTK